MNGQESVPYIGLYLLVGYGLGARRPHAPTGEPERAVGIQVALRERGRE